MAKYARVARRARPRQLGEEDDIVEAQGKGKVVPFPERARRPAVDNPLAVRCHKSGRWIEFPFCAEGDAAGVEILWVRVRTRGKDGRPRTVCELECGFR